MKENKMHDNNPFQNIKDDHRQNLHELGDTFKGKLKLGSYAARRGLQLIGLQRQEKKMQKQKEGLMDLIRSGNAPPLSALNRFTDKEVELQDRGDRMAKGIRSALRLIRGKPITESVQDLLNTMGYYQQDDGTWKHEKTGKVLSDKHAQDIAAERAARNPARPWTAGGENDPDMKGGNRFESLFHKDSDRLLREHIRAEYEARGIYPTTREVQETFNHIVDLLEKTRASQRDAILAKQHGTSGTEAGLIRTKQKLRSQRAGNSAQDFGDPARINAEKLKRQGAHAARRGVRTRVSPSSPAREQSKVEIDTRRRMGEGESPAYQRLGMIHTGR